jgi:AbrB family looped-hinge helix DNA binding protein
MAKVTSKLQVTIPKALAEQYGIRPGDSVDWVPAGDAIRVVPAATRRETLSIQERLQRFDEATERQAEREQRTGTTVSPVARGWTREDLYGRGRLD